MQLDALIADKMQNTVGFRLGNGRGLRHTETAVDRLKAAFDACAGRKLTGVLALGPSGGVAPALFCEHIVCFRRCIIFFCIRRETEWTYG